METNYENRKYERYYCQSPVMIYSQDDPDNYYYGLSYNYSKGGMYIKTDGKLEDKKNYIVKMINYDKNSDGPDKYPSYYASVKWSQSAESYSYPYSHFYYSYGIEYSKPATYS